MRYLGLLQAGAKSASSDIPLRSDTWRVIAGSVFLRREFCTSAHHLERSGQHHCVPRGASLRSRQGRAVGGPPVLRKVRASGQTRPSGR